jgi:hypothetical protein
MFELLAWKSLAQYFQHHHRDINEPLSYRSGFRAGWKGLFRSRSETNSQNARKTGYCPTIERPEQSNCPTFVTLHKVLRGLEYLGLRKS